MPDARKHRGPDHADRTLFAEGRMPRLRAAVEELSWLAGRGYAESSALKLVGDRHQLKRRQRDAVRRAACAQPCLESRASRLLAADGLAGRSLRIDGFNVIITVEAALSGAAVFRCKDGCLRDIASVHGSYRQVEETLRAVTLVGDTMAEKGVRGATWLLDSPVSNSGRLRNLIRSVATNRQWAWEVFLVKDPDKALLEPGDPVASSDAPVLDRCDKWVDLARLVVDDHVPGAWTLDLG